MKFLLYSLAGGLIMLVAVIALYFAGPGGTDGFLVTQPHRPRLGPTTERLLFLGFFFAFAIKAPMLPVHTWLPDAAAEAPPPAAVLLVGVLDKVGTFGMIRFCLPLFPDAAKWATPVVIVLARHLDRLRRPARHRPDRHHAADRLHLGQPLRLHRAGHLRDDVVGPAGSTLYMVNHGFSTAALFLVAAMLVARRGSQAHPGLRRRGSGSTPLLAGVFLVAGLSAWRCRACRASSASSWCWSGTFPRYPVGGGHRDGRHHPGGALHPADVPAHDDRPEAGDRGGHAATCDRVRHGSWRRCSSLIVGLGFYPKPVLDVINPAVERTMTQVGVTDPSRPTVDAAAEGTAK